MPLIALAADERLLEAARQLAVPGASRSVWEAISHAADFGLIWIVLAVVIALVLPGRDWRVFVAVLAAMIVAEVAADVLKLVVARPRPVPSARELEGLGVAWIVYSFPSGHAARSFAAAGVLAARRPLWLRVPVFVLAVAITLSRVVLALHWPSDALVGMVLGLLAGLLIARVFLSAPGSEDRGARKEPSPPGLQR